MPSVSQSQRAYLAKHMGVEWMRAHGFDNRGKLPARVGKKKKKRKRKGTY